MGFTTVGSAANLGKGIFSTSAVGKTKTQAQNSRKKTQEKKLKLREAFPKKVKKLKKKVNFDLFQGGGTCFAFLLTNIFNFKSF